MADSVNAPLLNVAASGNIGAKNVNSGDLGPKSTNRADNGGDDAFDQVLSKQADDRGESASAGSKAPADAAQNGKSLPGQRSDAAASPAETAEGDAAGSGKTDGASAVDAARVDESPDAAATASRTAASTVFADLAALESRSASDAGGLQSVQGAGAAPTLSSGGEAASSGAYLNVGGNVGMEQASGVERALSLSEKPGADAAAGVSTGAGADRQVIAAQAASPGTAAGAASLTADLAGAKTGIEPEFSSVASPGTLNKLDPLQPSAAERAAVRPGALVSQAASDFALQSGSQQDAAAQMRSRSDWLRFGMGSETGGQFAASEAGGEDFAELLRAPAFQARADASTGTGSAVAATLAPGAAGAAAASSTAAPSASTAAQDLALMHAPQEPEFAGELTARMKTLVRDGVREARLQLNPAELGRLQVTVSTEGDQARVSFVAETPAAREAIEQSLPRLREMLEQNGMQLAHSDVDQRGLQDGRTGQEDDGSPQRLAGESAEPGADSEPSDDMPYGIRQISARIDTYI